MKDIFTADGRPAQGSARQPEIVSALKQGKRCGKCRLMKPFAEFYKSKWAKDGHQTRCKPCQNFWRWQNKKAKIEVTRAKENAWRKQPHRKEQMADYQRLYAMRKRKRKTG